METYTNAMFNNGFYQVITITDVDEQVPAKPWWDNKMNTEDYGALIPMKNLNWIWGNAY